MRRKATYLQSPYRCMKWLLMPKSIIQTVCYSFETHPSDFSWENGNVNLDVLTQAQSVNSHSASIVQDGNANVANVLQQ